MNSSLSGRNNRICSVCHRKMFDSRNCEYRRSGVTGSAYCATWTQSKHRLSPNPNDVHLNSLILLREKTKIWSLGYFYYCCYCILKERRKTQIITNAQNSRAFNPLKLETLLVRKDLRVWLIKATSSIAPLQHRLSPTQLGISSAWNRNHPSQKRFNFEVKITFSTGLFQVLKKSEHR